MPRVQARLIKKTAGPDKDWYQFRIELLFQSYILWVVKTTILQSIGVTMKRRKKSRFDQISQTMLLSRQKRRQAGVEMWRTVIEEIAQILNISSPTLSQFVFYENEHAFPVVSDRTNFYQRGDIVSEPGFYIRIDSQLSEREVLSMFRRLKNYILPEQAEREVLTQKNFSFLQDYLDIETEFIKMEKMYTHSQEEWIRSYENKRPSLRIAIERVVGSRLTRLEKEPAPEDEVRANRKLENSYRFFLQRFDLPNQRKQSQILRLLHARA